MEQIKTTNMKESIDPEYLGIENDEYRFKTEFSGFNTETRINIQSGEASLILTDEIAEFFGFKSADDLLRSDIHLDALNLIKSKHGTLPCLKVRCMNHITQ